MADGQETDENRNRLRAENNVIMNVENLNMCLDLLYLVLFVVLVGLIDVLIAIVFVLPLASVVWPSIGLAVLLASAGVFLGACSGEQCLPGLN